MAGSDPLIQISKAPSSALPEWYYVTTLSNFARGYDKYGRRYSKGNIPESAYPDQFFLLKKDELSIGLGKGRRLLEKTGIENDRLIALKTRVPADRLRNDHPSGLGQYIPQNYIDLDSVYLVDEHEKLSPLSAEEATARSFKLLGVTLAPWDELTPRTVSVLPIAMACQASCKFCFSKASVSSDFQGKISDWGRIADVLHLAKERGAERAVITGGGEPTLLKGEDLTRLVGMCAAEFNKVVLITNGYRLAQMPAEKRLESLRQLDHAGLSVLAVSRHHHDPAKNAAIMGLDTLSENVMASVRENRGELRNITPRFVCVLQKGGIENAGAIGDYLSWAARQGVRQVNFKELYVSTGIESSYSDRAANAYSEGHQVPLKAVFDFAARHNWQKVAELPWGAPVFRGAWDGQDMQIAAYTEPSVYWERTHGTARSWNLMADGTVLASLEDPASRVAPR